ncbi:MAG: hypothetical protein QXO47_10105 [Thermoproteota archaeon]
MSFRPVRAGAGSPAAPVTAQPALLSPALDLATLKSLQSSVVLPQAQNLNITGVELSDSELTLFAQSYNRAFLVTYQQGVFDPVFKDYLVESMLGAIMAKAQMNATIGGEQPSSNTIGGPIPIMAPYLGVGYEWEDGSASIPTGTVYNWIQSGTTFLGGTAGHPVKVGKYALHVVFGIASRAPAPKPLSVQFTVNSKPTSIYNLQPLKYPGTGDLRFKRFNNALIWNENTTVLGQLFVSPTFGPTVSDALYLIGVMYVLQPYLTQYLNPATLPGTTNNVILTT